jgi:hypothetical protein
MTTPEPIDPTGALITNNVTFSILGILAGALSSVAIVALIRAVT